MQLDNSTQVHYCLFGTSIGHCGVAWGERGLTRVQLPESDKRATEQRLRKSAAESDDPPPSIMQVIAAMQRYLAGDIVEFDAVTLDLTNTDPFRRKVYDAARSLRWGQTTSYGALARQIGLPEEARAVGQALGRNPVPIVIPCHRVLASGDRIGGFSAFGGTLTKKRLLALEGAGTGLLPGMLLPSG